MSLSGVGQSYISYERDSQFEEDAQVGGRGVAAQEAVSIQQGRQDARHLEDLRFFGFFSGNQPVRHSEKTGE